MHIGYINKLGETHMMPARRVINCLLGLIIGLSASHSALASCAPWLKHDLKQLHSGQPLDVCAVTAGKPLLLVNTASHCGFTGQFEGLEQLHQEYKDQGLVIIGFPSNAFNQAALNEEEAAKVCFYNFGVTFLMSQTLEITGDNAHPLFQHLTDQQGKPTWNFNKYLVDKNGEVVDRYRQWISPTSWVLKSAIEKLL
jgi:glutathione peroxidase